MSSSFSKFAPSTEHDSVKATLLAPKSCPQVSANSDNKELSIASFSSDAATYGNAKDCLDFVKEACSYGSKCLLQIWNSNIRAVL